MLADQGIRSHQKREQALESQASRRLVHSCLPESMGAVSRGCRLDEKSLLGSSAFLAHDFVVFLLLSVAQLKLPAIDSFVSRRVRE